MKRTVMMMTCLSLGACSGGDSADGPDSGVGNSTPDAQSVTQSWAISSDVSINGKNLSNDSRSAITRKLELFLESPHRLVTLWGPAGIGKTSLASQFLSEQETRGGQVRYCDLSDCESFHEVCRVVAQEIHLPLSSKASSDEQCQAIGRGLSDSGISLLLLDNCEQIVDIAVRCVSEWIEASDSLDIVVTSRERLRCRYEHLLEVGSLPLPQSTQPADDSAAVQLFVRQARHAQADFEVVPENERALASLVTRLDGNPLAIGLAAAHVNTFGIQGILDNLAQQLDLLRGPRDAIARHASLRAAISWSWELLSDVERRVLGESSRFRGGFSLSAALKVLSVDGDTLEVLDALQSLRDKSMVQGQQVGARGTAESWQQELAIRFRHYPSIRLFAAEQRKDDAAVERFQQYFVQQASDLATAIETRGCPQSFRTLSDDRANLEQVLRTILRSSSPSSSDALVVALALDPVFTAEGPRQEHISILGQVLDYAANGAAAPGLRSRVYRARANAQRFHGELEQAEVDLTTSMDIDFEEEFLCESLTDLGVIHHQRRHLTRAEHCYKQALEGKLPTTPARTVARTMGNLAAIAHDRGLLSLAYERYREALALLGKIGDVRLEAMCLANLSIVEMESGDFSDANVHVTRAVQMLEALGDHRLLGITLGTMATLHHVGGQLASASTNYKRAIELMGRIGEERSQALSRGRMGAVLACMGRLESARLHIDQSERVLEQLGDDTAREAIGLARCFVDLTMAGQAKVDKRGEQCNEHLTAVLACIESAQKGTADRPALVERSDDARTFLRILGPAILQLQTGSLPADYQQQLVVGPEARFFRAPGGEWQDLRRKHPMRQILMKVIAIRHIAPGQVISLRELQQAGWPNEKIQDEAGANRVYVVLNKLRKMGLETLLLRGEGGYLLSEEAQIQRIFIDCRVFQ